MKFIKNEAVDFIFAFRRFGIRNKSKNVEYPRLKEIDNWCIKYEKELSPFLVNDISILSKKTILITLFLFDIIRNNPDIKTSNDFINELSKISANDFTSTFKNNLLRNLGEDFSVEDIYNAIINDGLHPGYDIKEEATLLHGFLKNPQDFLNRLISTLTQFNQAIYLPSINSFKSIYDEKYNWHNNFLSTDSVSYLKSLGLNSLIQEYPNLDDFNFYFSLFLDDDVFALWNNKSVIIGAANDTKIIQFSAKNKSDIFFSSLGDPKRLEIIRLTSKRPWYSSELATHFKLKPATLSYHINKLVEADLLRITQGEAKRLYYTLNKDALKTYLSYVSQDLLGLTN